VPYLSYPRVQETTTTTGTGNITLAGAVTDRVALQLPLSLNDYLDYCIDDGAGNWEVGIGQLTASTTLVRTAVLYSSNSNNAVSFGVGTKTVALVMSDAQLDAIDDLFFGDGSDGNVTISSGTTTPTRTMYYKSLTINGTGKLDLSNGFPVFVSEVLDLTSAPAGAITTPGISGNNATGATGGTGGGTGATNITPRHLYGQNGPNGATGVGTAGVAAQVVAYQLGSGGGGGAGGSGASGAGGSASSGASQNVTPPKNSFDQFNRFTSGVLAQVYVSSGGSGASGAGDGTNSGGGGGGGGGAGGCVWINARIINRNGLATATGAIRALGGGGGAGGNAAAGNCGGGGGGGGGAGGWLLLRYLHLIGTSVTNMLDASGGKGANGGSKTGTGNTGSGGNGGSGGTITLVDLGTNTTTVTTGSAGSAGAGQTGGAGGTCQVSL